MEMLTGIWHLLADYLILIIATLKGFFDGKNAE